MSSAIGRLTEALTPVGAVVLVVVLVVPAPGCRERVDPRRVVLHDTGALCIGAATESDGGEGGLPAGVDVRPGEPLAITVRSACLSNVCATARSAKCTVKRDGERLVVTSDLGWLGPEEIGRRCPSDCTFLDAQCTTEPLAAGSYKVVLGSRALDLTLPSHRDARCDSALSPNLLVSPPVVVDAAPTPATPAMNMEPSAVPAAPGTGVVAVAPPGDTICVGPPSAATRSRALRTGQPVAITVLHKNLCLGSSCTAAPGKCTAKRKGMQIVVSAQFPSSKTKPTLPCTEDCSAIAATCRTDGLPAGSYTIELGTQRRTLQIPAPTPPPCEERGP